MNEGGDIFSQYTDIHKTSNLLRCFGSLSKSKREEELAQQMSPSAP